MNVEEPMCTALLELDEDDKDQVLEDNQVNVEEPMCTALLELDEDDKDQLLQDN